MHDDDGEPSAWRDQFAPHLRDHRTDFETPIRDLADHVD
jgi:hypothetical protein